MSHMLSQSVLSDSSGTLDIEISGQRTACILCRRLISFNNEGGDLEAIDMCGDCKFLFLEDLGTPTRDGYQRRHGLRRRRRRRRDISSESIGNLFSQQFLNVIDLARNNQALLMEHDNLSLNGDSAARLSQRANSHMTPSGSRRWRRVLSDTESDGFGSLYGESETTVSLTGYRYFQGDSDTLSYSAYGGDSDASVDGHSALENDALLNPDGGTDFETDTDIDPMHAGLYHWNSDDHEEEADDEEDIEWEEGEVEASEMNSLRVGSQLQRSMTSYRRRLAINWHRQITSLGSGDTTQLRVHDREQTQNSNIVADLREAESRSDAVNFEEFIDARGFEELLQRLAENDNLRRGAPPAAVSSVKNLPCIIVKNDHENLNDLACAICKDSIFVGTVVNQLPCFHIYHPTCIAPWLSTRNSCPLCRFELPTDDKDYENGKEIGSSRLDLHDVRQQGLNGDSSSDFSDGSEAEDGGGLGSATTVQAEVSIVDAVAESSGGISGRSFLHRVAAAAPIVSVVGIVLVLWLGNAVTGRRPPSAPPLIHGHRQEDRNTYFGSHGSNNRDDSGRRQWWSLL